MAERKQNDPNPSDNLSPEDLQEDLEIGEQAESVEGDNPLPESEEEQELAREAMHEAAVEANDLREYLEEQEAYEAAALRLTPNEDVYLPRNDVEREENREFGRAYIQWGNSDDPDATFRYEQAVVKYMAILDNRLAGRRSGVLEDEQVEAPDVPSQEEAHDGDDE